MKFHDCMCKGQAIMCQLPFSIFNAVTLTFDLLTHEIYRAHFQHMGSPCVKFHDERC